MISFVNTLNKLANAANSEAVKLQAKKDDISLAKAQALFSKQGIFVELMNLAQSLEKDIAAFSDPADHKLNAVFDALLVQMNDEEEDIKDLPINDKKIIAAVDSPEIFHAIGAATTVLNLLKQNLELRQQALKASAQTKTLAESKRLEFIASYKKRCQEDNETLLAALKDDNPFAFANSLDQANQRWVELLKHVFNIEVAGPAKAIVPTNSLFSDVFKKGIHAVSKLAKDMMGAKSKKEKKSVFMGFLGTLISMAIGLFANLFKSFFGNTTEERETNVNEFTDNVSHFVLDMFNGDSNEDDLDVEVKSKAKAKAKAKPKATLSLDDEMDLEDDADLEDDLDVEGAPILPFMTRNSSKAKSTSPSTYSASTELSAEALAKAFSFKPTK